MLDDVADGAMDVSFADEKISRVGIGGAGSSHNRRQWVVAGAKKEDLSPGDIARVKAQGGPSAKAALGVSYQGVGTLSFVEKGVKINKDVYREQVKKAHYSDMVVLSGNKAVFTQDGASSHAAKTVKAYLKSCSFKTLEPWPANSLDLTPMDYGVWGILARAVEARQPKTPVDLKAAIRRAAPDLKVETARKITDDFPKRLQACVGAGGEQFERTTRKDD